MEMTKYMRILLALGLTYPASICAQGPAVQDIFPDDTTGFSSMSRYLDEVVVTGTLTARTLKNTPVLTRLISGNDIRESGAVTVLEALENFMPGVNFSPNAMGDNIQIQGLDNKYILILVDGERLVNERTENVNFSRLNASDVKRIEIINGASSVLYGSNAIGAVINIITKDVDKPFQGLARLRYSNYNSYVGDASVGFKLNDFTSKTSLSAKNSDGYLNIDPYSDYALSQVFKYRHKDRWNAELKGTYYHNESWYLQKFQTRLDHNYTIGGKLQYFFSSQHALALSLNSDAYKGDQVYKLRHDSTVFVNSSRYTSLRLVDSWDVTELIQLVSGGEINWEETFSYNQFGFDPGWKDASNANLFAQAEFKTESGLEALAGARYTHHSQFGGYFSPKISLMYRSGDFRFRGNISNGYKAPTLKELYMNFPHRIGEDVPFWVIGNEALVPEESWYKAFSAEYIVAKLNVSLIVHHNSIKNKINTEQIWNEAQSRTEMKYRNVEDARIMGIDLSWQWSFLQNFQLKGGYSYADAIDQQTRRQLSGNSKHTATLNLVFKQQRLPFVSSSISCPYSLLLSGRAMSPHIFYSEDANGEIVGNSTGSYFLSNAVYTQQFPLYKEIKGDLQLGVNNLLNYVNRDALANNPGRRFFVSLGLSF
jgi:outer membrane receptor for ferrienterochelin and colicins